jgi:hypothetical protein
VLINLYTLFSWESNLINVTVPPEQPPTLLFVRQETALNRIQFDGEPVPGNTTLHKQHVLAMDFDHRNGTVCFVHWVSNSAVLRCAKASNFSHSWDLPPPSMFSLECKYHSTCK